VKVYFVCCGLYRLGLEVRVVLMMGNLGAEVIASVVAAVTSCHAE
jgi:hypothetical protein